jgi:predicted metal-dependent peptidase
MFVTNLTEEQRLAKAVVAIMGNPKYTALAGVLMIGDRTVTDDPSIPTACTNGRDEMYDRAFVSSLSDAELRFLVLHEVYHKLFKHLHIWRHLYDEDPDLANRANDYVINIKIVDDNDDGFATMTGVLENGCLDEKYRGMDSAQVYNLLRKQQRQNPPGEGNTGGGGGGGSSKLQDQQPFDQHDWDGAQELTADEKRELARDLDEAIRQGALVAGKMGSGGDRDLEELLQPQVNWREALREFIQDTCAGKDYSTYRKPNRRYLSAGIYMPSGVTEQVGELILAIDTSGSIGNHELSAFLSEVKSICDTVHPDGIRLLYWDTRICRDEKYDSQDLDELVKSTKPKGGGGTDVTCVTDYIREHNINAQACIVLTDGHLYGGWGQWTMPVLWTILDNDGAKPDVGKTVNIKSRDM